MADTMHIPGLGDQKKTTVYLEAAAVTGILAIAYYRHSKNAAAAVQAAAATPASTDTSTQDPNAIDPSTGLTYAEEASGSQGSFGGYGGSSNYGGSYYGNGNITGYDQYGNPIYSTGITGNNTYTTNADWATAAESLLAANNVDTATSATAISRILAGLTVTTAQQDLFMEAVGQLGQPPQGYPKPIKLTDTGGQPGSNTTVQVPNVVGQRLATATGILSSVSLHIHGPSEIKNVAQTVTGQNPKAGSTVNKGSTVTVTTKRG